MAQIGFTHKTEHVYDRFEKMRRAYEDAHGRTYAPGFLTVLMDAFLLVQETRENDRLIWEIETKQAGMPEPVSLRAYIADAEMNERVVIKDGNNRYIENINPATTNLFMAERREEAMVFDNRDQAAALLRKCGHEAGNWIIEPA